jgi:hypothetical protein
MDENLMGLRSTKVGAFPCECSADAPDGHQHEPSCPVYVSEIDELRAAIEQTWRPEVTALRARNEELHRLYAEALARGDEERREAEDELRAEVERLDAVRLMLIEEREAWKAEALFMRQALREAVEAAEALRAALERIETGFHTRLSAAELASIARQAL